MTVLEAEWHLESEYTDFTNDVDATATRDSTSLTASRPSR